MPRQWVKEELKHDILRNFIEKAVPYVKTHRDAVITSGVIFIIIVAIATITITRFKKASQLATEQIGFAGMFLRAGQLDKTIQLCDQIIQTHPSGTQGGYAHFYRAESYYVKRNYDEAITSYESALPLLKNREDLKPMILFSMAQAYESAKKLPQAINTYKQLIDENSAHYLVPEAQLGIARCYEQTGDVQSAVSYYQTVGSLHPTTKYKIVADARIQALQKRQ
ncbi:MAG: tetratricopeptide repeat protein [Elusimicrobia bacterium]|nr:tetratricopeptide repeat protein [Elusimicrobiota bacterium]